MASIVETNKEKSIFVIVFIPLIVFGYAMFSPHFAHPDHFAHIAIHEAGFLISGFLTTVTVLAYRKTKIRRLAFSASAFVVLTFAQAVYLFLDMELSMNEPINYSSASEIFDLLIVVMTILFALGVFYNSQKASFR